MNKQRVFVDMDGVLATFHPEKSIEEIAVPGYFVDLEPMKEVVEAINKLISSKQQDVYILSAYLNKAAAQEKIAWLSKYLPAMESHKILLVPYGTDKSEFIKNETQSRRKSDILIDDFTFNLNTWHGTGVKLINKINNTKRSWTGFIVNGNADAQTIYASIKGICYATV
jgi:5'(3')-deoxyribonucleotidase